MQKAILYYLLLIAEFIVTIFVGGFALGIYIAYTGNAKQFGDPTNSIRTEFYPLIVAFYILCMLIIWFTFYKAKFSKLTWGNIEPANRMKTSFNAVIPILGFTMLYYYAIHFFDITLSTDETEALGYFRSVPFLFVGSFLCGYVFFGAILEELIQCGKKPWVSFVTLFVMMAIISVFTYYKEGTATCIVFLVDTAISLAYGIWIYGKTRSTILLILVYFITNLVPLELHSEIAYIFMGCVGASFLTSGIINIRKQLGK